ncbi:MAG: hypothetical protein KBT49_07315 [Bacteroidetes bacterium]|nr:hypothetical protein [Candidatus Colenecus caballi]
MTWEAVSLRLYIVVNLFVLFCNSLIVRTIGAQALPVFGLCIQFQSITFGVVVGICIAGISHISRLQGENDNDGIRVCILFTNWRRRSVTTTYSA